MNISTIAAVEYSVDTSQYAYRVFANKSRVSNTSRGFTEVSTNRSRVSNRSRAAIISRVNTIYVSGTRFYARFGWRTRYKWPCSYHYFDVFVRRKWCLLGTSWSRQGRKLNPKSAGPIPSPPLFPPLSSTSLPSSPLPFPNPYPPLSCPPLASHPSPSCSLPQCS